MTPAGIDAATLLWIGFALLAPGLLVFLKPGIWPGRHGRTPFCRQCNYNLTGLVSDRCPECGTHITPKTTVYGQRRGRPVVTIGALGCIVIGAIALVRGSQEYNWHRLRPVAWLWSDIESQDRLTSLGAWRELLMRDQDGRLSATQRDALIDRCLEAQTAPSISRLGRRMIQYLSLACRDEMLSEAQAKRFCRQTVPMTLAVRPRIAIGDPVPLRITTSGTRYGGTDVWLHLDTSPLLLDGQPTGYALSAQGVARAQNKSTVRTDHGYRCTAGPGRHVLSVVCRLGVYHGPTNRKDQSQLRVEDEIRLTAEFEVLETQPPNLIRGVADPSLGERLQAALRPYSLVRHAGPPTMISGTVWMRIPPVDVAFRILLRFHGTELQVASCTSAAGREKYCNWQMAWPDVLPETVDVILRSDEEVAKQTVDIFEYWKGELVYEGISVQRMP